MQTPRAKNHYGTCLEFVYDGQCHTRYLHDGYQPRYLVTLCKRFASGIVEGD